ncbi:hypothetical protein [Lunatibacter salilacus]|uniref:hypothetical protein n=1 Tax=Lunatibacter salilacus TaxID=2483804 RepID=UPI00131A7040|nr:hypothetical protein [Lunatibacter salilacus]
MVVKETQNFRSSWVMYLLVFIQVPMAILLTVWGISGEIGEDGYIGVLISIGLIGIVIWLFWNLELETRIDRYGLQYRCLPIISSWRKFPREEIVSMEVKKIGPQWRLGGMGIRYRIDHWVYAFNNKYSVLVTLKNKQFELSTLKPEEIRSMVAEWESEN